MKKIVLLFVILYSITLCSQSKQDTETWILEKLRLYQLEIGDNKVQNYLDGSNLKVSIRSKKTVYDQKDIIIPLWAIENVFLKKKNGSAGLEFKLKKYCKECKVIVKGRKQKYRNEYYEVTKYGWEQGRQVSWKEEKRKRVPDGYENTYNETTELDTLWLNFKTSDPEEDFIARFNKAIKHLQTLYPKKPEKKETF